jgi:predicted transcriptional regulator
MLSIRPKWCEKICNGEKTIEVRKTRPKLETPFKCYIYCTLQGCNEFFRVDLVGDVAKWRRGKWADRKGNVIGEFTCDRIYKIDKDSTDFLFKAGGLSVYKQAAEEKCGLSVAMTDDELRGYLGHCQGYGWHISDLKIYDKPKELSEFSRPFENCIDKVCDEFGCAFCENGGHIKRPPQSWCYVEEG